ncbi:MAG: SGNH/GDSL hydrolase family protein [Clostridiales bacterium]|nr:SGNH/GDSL hydrolase family protein [Clostridiales bacterium]
MKKHILCFGDSNTHGYCADPADCADGGIRFTEEQRWTQLLQEALGQDYLVIEEGLSGRTTCFDDPIHEGLNGLDYIYPCLKSHEAIDLLIIMLGTNDCKDRFYSSAACIGLGMARLVNKAKSTDCWGGKQPNILVIAPPPIGEGMLTSSVAATMGQLCVEKSRQLADSYREQCELLNVSFLDAGAIGCEFNTVDFMHLTSRGHRTLAEALAKLIPQLLR